jgi:TonB-linked SusC/RagA family outer membrane protein
MRKSLMLLAVLVLSSVLAFAQTKTISGKITDQLGQPVQFASVRIKGTKTGTSADADGNFSIKIDVGKTLIITGAGMTAKEVLIANESPLNIQVSRQQTNMTEVVVTALGIKRQPKQLGYSTAVVDAKNLNEVSVVNLATGLTAKVSGVDIRLADNSVNPTIKVTFRGSRSIAGDNGALIVIDGIIVDQSYLASMNPEDVENVTILKGANGAALYGKDASNGVMIITTKKGKKGQFSINYKNSTMWNKLSYMPKLQNEYSPNGGEPAPYIDPLTGWPLPVPYENQNFGPAYNSRDFPYTQIPIGFTATDTLYGPYKAYPDGRKDFFQTGVLEQNSLSVGAANNWGNFFASGQHESTQGIVFNDKSSRNVGRFNGGVHFGNFSAQGGISYAHRDVDQAGLVYGGGTQYRPVFWSVINQPPNIDLKTVKNVDGNVYDNPSGYINQYYTNPWYQVFHSRAKQHINTLISNLQLDYKFTPWLAFTARSGYNKTTTNDPSNIDSFSYTKYAASDPWGAGGTARTAPTMPYQQEIVKMNYDDWNSDGYFTGRYKVSDFDFTLIAGANYRRRTSHAYWYSNQAVTPTMVIPNSINKVNNADGSAYTNYSYKTYSQAAYADLTVGYDSWIFLHGSFRNDWLSILSPQTRSFNYEGGDVSFVLSDKFPSIVSPNGLSYLKARVSYAKTGNVSIPSTTTVGYLAGQSYGLQLPTYGAYGIYPGVSVGQGFPYGSMNGYSLSYNSVQPLLKPEQDLSSEFGIEIGFLGSRILLDASYYAIAVTNQTITSNVSGATGTGTLLLNSGKIQDNGIDLDLKLTPLLKIGKFNWNINANFSYLNNKVVYLTKGDTAGSKFVVAGSGSSVYNQDAISGKNYLSLMVSDWNRDPQGRVIVDQHTGLPSTNPNLVYAGNTNYKYMVGLTSSMNFKGFTLNAVFDYRGGAKFLASQGQALDFAGISATSATNRSHFIIPNSSYFDGSKYVANNSVPTTGTAAQYWSTTYNAISAPYVVSAAFWKLRELALGYDIPLAAIGLQKTLKRANFSVIAQNLFMWRPKTNQWTDPEFSSSLYSNANAVGVANEYVTPPVRSFGFSLSVTY